MKESEKYLSIRLRSDGFSLWNNDSYNQVRLDKSESSLFNLSETAFSKLLNELPEIIHQQQNLRLIFETPYYSLVPNALFQNGKEKEMLDFQFEEIPENWVIGKQSIEKFDSTLIYALPLAIASACNQILPAALKTHHIGFVIQEVQNDRTNTVHLLIRSSNTDLIWMSNNHPVIINHFHIKTTEDLIYHLFRICEELQISFDDASIHLYQDDKTISTETLKKYFPHVVQHNKTLLT